MAVVLVCDGEQRSALAVTRSLGRAGHEVYVCSDRKASLAGSSRYARAAAVVPSPLRAPAEHAAAVKHLVRDWSIDIVLPNTDASLLALLPIRDTIGATIPFAGAEEFKQISDKSKVAERASALGIAVPRQVRLDAPGSPVPHDVRFPLVLKPSRSVVGGRSGASKLNVQHLAARADLETALSALPREAFPVLLQQRVTGAGAGVFLLMHRGEAIAPFAHRRLREKPPSGGVSVLRESIPLDPRLLQQSTDLLRSFRWEGPAMVEYKIDQRTGVPYLMEINARFWGSLQLCVDSGVDYPAILVQIAMGQAPPANVGYKTGIRSRWLLGDLDHVLLRLFKPPHALALPGDAPGRVQTVLAFVGGFVSGARNEIFRLNDPAPAFREFIDWLRRA